MAALPLLSKNENITHSEALAARISGLLVEMARFDVELSRRPYRFSQVLCRTECAASIQLEQFSAGAIEFSACVNPSKLLNESYLSDCMSVVNQVLAMQKPISLKGLKEICQALHASQSPKTTGSNAKAYEDLIVLANSSDIDPITKAALVDAEFEAVGRSLGASGIVGRVLVQLVFATEGVSTHSPLPLSIGLVRNIGTYLNARSAYRKGDAVPQIALFVKAVEESLQAAKQIVAYLDAVVARWEVEIGERQGSAIRYLPNLLLCEPVVNTAYIAERLKISQRAALSLVNRACDYGILTRVGQKERGDYYAASEVVSILNRANTLPTSSN